MKHLEEHNMGYWVHLGFALKLSVQLLVMALLGIVHAVIPFVFKNVVSAGVKDMETRMQDAVG